MNRALRTLALVALLAACGSPPPPARRSAPPPAVPKPVTDDEVKPIEATNIYVYSPIGKRDPFQNTNVVATGVSHLEVKGRTKTALEKWPLDALKLAMTVTGTASPLAMVEDPDHRGWAVHLGDFIGQNGGKVTGIHRDEIIVTETITDHSTGRVYPQNVKLQVPITRDEERDINALQEGEHLGVFKGDK